VTFGPPKSTAGVREVALPERIGRLLAEHANPLAKEPDRLLFATASGGAVRSGNRCHIMILARQRTPGAEHLTWHGLRHTGLTLAASVPGATVRNIMDRGGHSTPRAALIYQHTATSADDLTFIRFKIV
jgi:integrase